MTVAQPQLPSRFRIESLVGRGASGAVYVAWDEQRGERIALKHLVSAGHAGLYRFKQEFRALANVAHPNLARLHELFTVGDAWYLTMELVEGAPFDAYLGVGPPQHEGAPDAATPAALPEPASPPEERLRGALRGLAAGVLAMHRAGVLHRDLKPSNVLVEPDGRVVILDFGLAAQHLEEAHVTLDRGIAGTPAYMSPEQAVALPLGPATDWYSVGVMLYEVLCGRLPFEGTARAMIAARAEHDPPDPRALRSGLPEDLCDLCMALLRRAPEERPTGAEVGRRLGLAPADSSASTGIFLGRDAHLDLLRDAFEEAVRGRLVVAHVRGASGLGKSALVRRFLDQLDAWGEAVVLAGRCYEREHAPYKALDGLMESLARHLRQLPPVRAAALLPRDFRALARIFPALARVEELLAVPLRDAAPDAREARRQAAGALRELLERLSDAGPLVVHLDDLQWGDADSAALLTDVLTPVGGGPRRILFVIAERPVGRSPQAPQAPGEDAAALDVSGVLRKAGQREGALLREIAVGPLDVGEGARLADALLGGGPHAEAESIARECGGSPLLLHALVRGVQSGRFRAGEVSLRAVIEERLSALPDTARRIAELLACAGRPAAEPLVRDAADLGGEEMRAAAELLVAEDLARPAQVRGQPGLELLHDAIREIVIATLDETTARRRHARLAAALAATPTVDVDALAHHLLAAGDREKAAPWAEWAGDRAAAALAYDHAAELFREAIAGAAEEDRPRLRRKFALALAHAGRGAVAARAFLDAAAGLDEVESTDLIRRAGEQLLRSGHIAEGLKVVAPVLRAHRLSPSDSPALLLASVLARRARLRLRGHDFRERTEAEVEPALLRRIELCWTLGNGLGGVDLLRSAGYQARHLLDALEAGEPYRIARALAWEAILATLEGGAGQRRAAALVERSRTLAERVAHPHALAWASGAATVVAWSEGRWRECLALSDEAIALFRERCADIAWEIGSLELWFATPALWFLGELHELSRRVPAITRDAEARGDLYALTTARAYGMPVLHLAADRPDAARREASDAVAMWTGDAWHLQHWAHLLFTCNSDLYDGEGARVLERITAAQPSLRRSMQLRVQNIRLQTHWLRGRGALDASDLSLARRMAGDLAREDNRWADGYAATLRAAIAAREQPETAPARFEEARARFTAMGMRLSAAACVRRSGELVGGDEGAARVAESERVMREAGVTSPARMADLLTPRPR